MDKKLSADSRAFVIDYLLERYNVSSWAKLRDQYPETWSSPMCLPERLLVEVGAPAIRERLEQMPDGELFASYKAISGNSDIAAAMLAQHRAEEEEQERLKKEQQKLLTADKQHVAELNRRAIRQLLFNVFLSHPEVASWSNEQLAREVFNSQKAGPFVSQFDAKNFPAEVEAHDRPKAFKGRTVEISRREPLKERTIRDRFLPAILKEWRETGGR